MLLLLLVSLPWLQTGLFVNHKHTKNANTCNYCRASCAGKTLLSGYGTVTEEKMMPGDWPFANGGPLFGQTDFLWGQYWWCWPRRCRERKCCRSPVDFLGWPPAGSRRTGCRPAGTCTVPPQSTFVRWTWSGLQNAQRNIPWSLWSKWNLKYSVKRCFCLVSFARAALSLFILLSCALVVYVFVHTYMQCDHTWCSQLFHNLLPQNVMIIVQGWSLQTIAWFSFPSFVLFF